MRLPLLVAALLLAGCAAPGPPPPPPPNAPVYTHDWTWGPANYPGTTDPVFHDTFAVGSGVSNLRVQATWDIHAGSAAVVLTPPSGDATNLTAPANGAGANAVTTRTGTQGTWDFRIPTWRTTEGAFPQGHVRVEVLPLYVVPNG